MTAPGFILNISRTYNSRDEEEGILGKGWAFGLEGSIKDYEVVFELEDGTPVVFTYDTIKIVKLPNGSTMTFEKDEEGKYTTKYARVELEEVGEGHILTTKDQYKYKFNTDGYMEYMEDRNGNRINIDTDDKGNILKAYDNLGRSFIFTYNSQDLLESIKGPKNKTITYYYEDKQLKKVQDPEGRYTYYNYDEEGKLEEVKDNEENTIEKIVYNYDAGPDKEKVNQLTDRFGNTHNYGYNNMERKVTITDTVTERENRQRVQWYNKDFQAEKDIDEEGNITEIMYNSNGEEMIIKTTTKEEITHRRILNERDDNGNIVKTTSDIGNTEAAYDEKNNMTMETDEEGNKTYYIYDSQKINLIKKVRPLNGKDEYKEGRNEEDFAITEYSYYPDNTYNIKGLLKEITDEEGNKTTYTYDNYPYVIG